MDESVSTRVEAVENVSDAEEAATVAEFLPASHASFFFFLFRGEEFIHEANEPEQSHEETSKGNTSNMESFVSVDRLSERRRSLIVPTSSCT